MNRDQILQLLDAVDDRFVTESTRFDPAQRPTERSAHMKSKRILTFALAAVLLLGLGVVAYAAGWIGPRAIVLEERAAYTAQRQEDGSVSVTDNPAGGWVTLSQPQDTPEDLDQAIREKLEAKEAAWAEWETYLAQNDWASRVPEAFVFPEGADASAVEENDDGSFTVVFYENGSVIERRSTTREEVDAYSAVMDAIMLYEGKYDFNYHCSSQEDEAKLEEIAVKYGLRLRSAGKILWSGDTCRTSEAWANEAHGTDTHNDFTGPQFLTDAQLAARIAQECCHGDFFYETPLGFDKFYYFDEGSFGLSWYVVFTPERQVTCYVYNAAYGTLVSGDEVISMADDLSAFRERSHSCPDGTAITVLQSQEQAYFYTYLDNSYLCGHINGSLSESEVDAVLDSVCWSNIGK